MPADIDAIIAGTATFISRTTPDNEVYVDEPVKFIATNAVIGGKTNK